GSVSFLRKQEPGGVHVRMSLDSRLRGNDDPLPSFLRKQESSVVRGALLVFLVLCSTATAAIRVTDDTGAIVELAEPARRIVSLAPHATELLFAAGAGSRVVAVLKGSDAPPQATALPIIGDVNGLDLQRMLALPPDL